MVRFRVKTIPTLNPPPVSASFYHVPSVPSSTLCPITPILSLMGKDTVISKSTSPEIPAMPVESSVLFDAVSWLWRAGPGHLPYLLHMAKHILPAVKNALPLLRVQIENEVCRIVLIALLIPARGRSKACDLGCLPVSTRFLPLKAPRPPFCLFP